MEKEALTKAMKSSISEVLEKMFYLPLDFPESKNEKEFPNLKTDKTIISRIKFSGPFSGYLLLYIPRELAESLTISFMGIDEDNISQDYVTSTVKEIINMITGNAFRNFDDQAVFDLGIPELINFDDMIRENSKSEEEIFISINTMESRMALQAIIY